MGYFRRKLDRGRSLDVARHLREMALEDDFHHVWEAIPDQPPKKFCYLRFSIAKVHPDSKRRMGVFRAAGELLDTGELGGQTSGVLDEALDWFNEHLPRATAVALGNVPAPGVAAPVDHADSRGFRYIDEGEARPPVRYRRDVGSSARNGKHQ